MEVMSLNYVMVSVTQSSFHLMTKNNPRFHLVFVFLFSMIGQINLHLPFHKSDAQLKLIKLEF